MAKGDAGYSFGEGLLRRSGVGCGWRGCIAVDRSPVTSKSVVAKIRDTVSSGVNDAHQDTSDTCDGGRLRSAAWQGMCLANGSWRL